MTIKNGIRYPDCFICGDELPENVMSDEWHSAIGIVYICPKCYEYWDKDDAKGMSMKKAQGWSRVYQNYIDSKEAI